MNFIEPLLGGVLIGVSAVLLMLTMGRICGISGMLAGALQHVFFDRFSNPSEHNWRWLFLLGLIIGSLITHHIFSVSKPSSIDSSWAVVIISGLLVGFGTKLGSGCTSGHGVCGIARLSMRSLMATITFMLSGVVVVYLVRHVFQ